MITLTNHRTGPSMEYGPNGSFTVNVRFNNKLAFVLFEPGSGGPMDRQNVDQAVETELQAYFDTEILPKEPFLESSIPGHQLDNDLELHLCGLLENLAQEKQIKRWCKTKVVVVLEGAEKGSYATFKCKYSPEVAAKIRERNPDVVEIVNERFL